MDSKCYQRARRGSVMLCLTIAIWMGIGIMWMKGGMYLHQGTVRITTSKSQPGTRRPTMLTCQAWPRWFQRNGNPGWNRLSHKWLSAILFLVVPRPGLSFQIRCSCCQKAGRDWQRRALLDNVKEGKSNWIEYEREWWCNVAIHGYSTLESLLKSA